MPTLVQMRNTIDTFLENKWPAIVARQETFFANRGRYWQGLITHSVLIAHTSAAYGSRTPDRLETGPSDQQSTWMNVFPEWLPELMPASFRIDVYNSPAGQGWVATVEATYNGVLYRRSRNVGPLVDRTEAWHVVSLMVQ